MTIAEYGVIKIFSDPDFIPKSAIRIPKFRGVIASCGRGDP
jgi:hypothetical protein